LTCIIFSRWYNINVKIESNNTRKYSVFQEEIKSVRKEAIRVGKNPDEAEAVLKAKIEMANARDEVRREEERAGVHDLTPEAISQAAEDIKNMEKGSRKC